MFKQEVIDALLYGKYYLSDIDVFTYESFLTLNTLKDQTPDALAGAMYKILDEIEWPLHVEDHPKQQLLERLAKAIFMQIDSLDVGSLFSRVWRPYRQNESTPLHWTPTSPLWNATRDREHRWFFSNHSVVLRWICNDAMAPHWTDPDVGSTAREVFSSSLVKDKNQTFIEFGLDIGERFLGWPSGVVDAFRGGFIPMDIEDKCAWVDNLLRHSTTQMETTVQNFDFK